MKPKRDDIRVGHVVFNHQKDVFAPPPPGSAIHSSFKTIHEWLSALCDAEPPTVSISVYSFGVFESPDEWLLFVVGENTTEQDQYNSVTHIDFKPSLMYFLLPHAQYADKPGNEVKEQLRQELKAFTQTEKFHSSFFAKADVAEWNGERFWCR